MFYNVYMGMNVSSNDGKSISVAGRIARMIAWLLRNRQSIDRAPKGSVTFHFAGERSLTAELVHKEDA